MVLLSVFLFPTKEVFFQREALCRRSVASETFTALLKMLRMHITWDHRCNRQCVPSRCSSAAAENAKALLRDTDCLWSFISSSHSWRNTPHVFAGRNIWFYRIERKKIYFSISTLKLFLLYIQQTKNKKKVVCVQSITHWRIFSLFNRETIWILIFFSVQVLVSSFGPFSVSTAMFSVVEANRTSCSCGVLRPRLLSLEDFRTLWEGRQTGFINSEGLNSSLVHYRLHNDFFIFLENAFLGAIALSSV